MATEDYEDLYPLRQIVVHRITEQEKNEYANKKIAEFFWGSRKQWRTVMMIEVNTHRYFVGTTYGDLHNFIAMYIDEAIEVSRTSSGVDLGGSLGGDLCDDYYEQMVDYYFNRN